MNARIPAGTLPLCRAGCLAMALDITREQLCALL